MLWTFYYKQTEWKSSSKMNPHIRDKYITFFPTALTKILIRYGISQQDVVARQMLLHLSVNSDI
jgi:hypothetical protein